MTDEKFEIEIDTLKKFFSKYCNDKHKDQKIKDFSFKYNDKEYNFSCLLCDDCEKLISYSFDRLKSCPHKVKPRCRKCPNPCYEKTEWKKLAKVMKYSAIQFGLSRIKKFLFS